MITWIIGIAVLALVAAIVRKLVSDRRNGKTACGGNCQTCPMHCGTHTR